MKIKIFILYIFFLNLKSTNCNEQLALIISPVADLISENSNFRNFTDISFSPVNKKDSFSCPRLHQVLFNEVVTIVSQAQNSFIVQTKNAFYETLDSKKKLNKFKIHKSNVIAFNDLIKNKLNLQKIPKPIDFHVKLKPFDKTITLTSFFYDPLTDKTYSAGTRFVFYNENADFYYCYVFHNKTNKFDIIPISKEICINNYDLKTKEKRTLKFVEILKQWSNLGNSFITYVWGGCSFCQTFNSDFITVKNIKHTKLLHYYELINETIDPKTGFDCSGLIFRAAQICGIPFYFKNSTTILKNLKELKADEEPENGDIIWIPGHVMVISDLKKGLFIEATDYSTGYGKVQEVPLKQSFKSINNYQSLKQNSLAKKDINRLDRFGKIYQTTNKLKILKLKSIYE